MNRIPVKQLMLCLSLIVFSCLFAKAQVVSCYFSNDDAIDPGSTITADLRVDSFIDVISCSFSVNWDPAVLQFKELKNLGLTLSELSGINDIKAASHGELGFLWIGSSLTMGVTLPDSAIIFSLVFEVIGNPEDTTSLKFTDQPTGRDFVNVEAMPIPFTLQDAPVTVNTTSNTFFNSAPEKISLYPPVPNPFHENTLVKIDLQQAAHTTIKIIDQMGKVLYEDQQYLSAGMQNIPISKEIFHQSGTYYCLLHANDFRVMQKLVFIDR